MKNIKFSLKIFSLGLLIFGTFFVVKVSNSAANNSRLADNLAGKILLQVEEKGEAWYVNPQTKERSFLGRPDDAFQVMRQEAVGITGLDLNKISISLEHIIDKDSDGDGLSDDFEKAIGTDPNKKDTDGDGFDDYTELLHGFDPLKGAGARLNYDNSFTAKQKGMIFLDVERNGEAWYVNPEDGKRYFLGRPSDAFELMRRKGLGITNANLNQIGEKGRAQMDNQAGNQINNQANNQPKSDTANNSASSSANNILSQSSNYSADILACTKNKSFNFTSTKEHPFVPSALAISNVKTEILGLNSESKCKIKVSLLDIDYEQNPKAFYNYFMFLATIDGGYSEDQVERLYNEPMANLTSDELEYLRGYDLVDDLSLSVKDKANEFDVEFDVELDDETLAELELTKEALPMHEYCSGTPEKILEHIDNLISVDSNITDLAFSFKISGSKSVTTYENGVVCESDIVMTQNDN